MKRAVGLVILIITTMLICSCSTKDYVVASVNGEDIYHSEIQKAVDSLNDASVTYQIILRNSINELIVVQMAPALNICVDEEEFETYISGFKTKYPDYYATGVEIYGETEYIEGLYRQKVFRLVKEYIINNVIIIPDTTYDDLAQYCQEKGIDITTLSDEEYEWISNRAQEEKKDILFFSWMLDQWENNDIVINDSTYSITELCSTATNPN